MNKYRDAYRSEVRALYEKASVTRGDAEDDVDTSDISEAPDEWFDKAQWRVLIEETAMKLDAKFYVGIEAGPHAQGHRPSLPGDVALRKVKNGSIVPDDEYMVFLAKDNAFAAMLPGYLAKCRELGCDQEHIEAVERTINRVEEWRRAHPDRCKNPDAKGEKLLDRPETMQRR